MEYLTMATRHAAKLRIGRSDRIHTQLRHAATLEQYDNPPRHSAAYRFRMRQPTAYAAGRGERIYGWVDTAYRTTSPRPLSSPPRDPATGQPLPARLSAWGREEARHLLRTAQDMLLSAAEFDTPGFYSGTAAESYHECYANAMARYLELVSLEDDAE
jgi:hypothetical protein